MAHIFRNHIYKQLGWMAFNRAEIMPLFNYPELSFPKKAGETIQQTSIPHNPPFLKTINKLIDKNVQLWF